MKEPRFIELLNLYVDQQLSAQEAAELEAEIQQNPARRRTYQQYCRMQKGCALLFEHERTTAPASTALARAMADADRKIVAFPEEAQRRSLWPAGFSIAAVAAAACVALVVVFQANQGGVNSAGPSELATAEPTVEPVSVASTVAGPAVEPKSEVVLAAATVEEFKPIFTVQPLAASAAKTDGLFVSVSEDDARLQDWTHQVQLKPLRKVSIEEFAFDVRAKPESPAAPFTTSSPEEPATELNAVMFTR